jgi:class 3 adenylate cyclase
MGDGILAEFQSVVDAVRSAIEMQQALSELNER